MPAGLQVFDGSGNVVLEVTDSTAKYLGTLSVAASSGTPQSGTITDTGFSLGTSWYLTTLPASTSLVAEDSATVSVSGNVLSWTTESSCPAFILYYGVI